MEPTNFDEYKALMRQADFNIARFDNRRDYSWKVSIGFWASLLGSATVVVSSELAIDEQAVYIGAFSIVFLHTLWLRGVFEANKKDKQVAFEARDIAMKLTGMKPPTDRTVENFYKNWSVQFQWGTSVLLTAVVVYLVSYAS